MKKIFLTSFLCIHFIYSLAQSEKQDFLHFSGYTEGYYQYNPGFPAAQNRPDFIYSHNRINEVNINLAFLKAAMEKERVRANLAIMTGTYANANLAAEPGVLKNIYEANIGVKLSSGKNLWVDAGIFGSHIGFESAVSKDCPTLTRSIIADNSPYYESGIKAGYTSENGKWFLCGLFLNGWQRIQRIPGNSTPAAGHQLTFKPKENITLNSSSFIGSDTPDSTRRMRYFHNLYALIKVNNQCNIVLGWDIGFQQAAQKSNLYHPWSGGALICTYSPLEKIKVSARAEYYQDKHNVLIQPTAINGFRTTGYSLNLDYHLFENTVWRMEGKIFHSPDAIYMNKNRRVNQNYNLITSLAVSF